MVCGGGVQGWGSIGSTHGLVEGVTESSVQFN